MTDETPEADVTEEITAAPDAAQMMRKKQLVEEVAVATGLKRREVREALDSAFAIVRQSLLDGQEVDYPTLGKVKIKVREGEEQKPQYRVTLAKNPPAAAGAEAEEDGDAAATTLS